MHDPAPTPGSRQLLVVAGSGRSGTSLFTGLTGRLGVHIPQPEVIANSSNPRGFGEPRWLVDYHTELLASADVTVEDGRPEAWGLTDAMAERADALGPLVEWLESQFAVSSRIVVKDPRLAWFFQLHRLAAEQLGAQLRVATMLRHPGEVMRSRELAYGTRTNNTTRTVGWLTMMLGIERRTRDLPRATVRYDDLLADWQAALKEADATMGIGLFEAAPPEQVADAAALVDPTLYRSTGDWDELDLPPRVLDLAVRAYDAYGRLVGVPAERQADVHAELDAVQSELTAYYDECFDVARSRTGSVVRRERRKAARRARAEATPVQEHRGSSPSGRLLTLAKRARARLRGSA
jgi:hypothetical protein